MEYLLTVVAMKVGYGKARYGGGVGKTVVGADLDRLGLEKLAMAQAPTTMEVSTVVVLGLINRYHTASLAIF